MEEPLIIKYETNAEGFDLGVLGESFVGLNTVLKEFCDLANVNGEVEIKTTRIEHGSVELYNIFHLTLAPVPFSTPQDLFDFLRIARPELLKYAHEFFSNFKNAHDGLNAYFSGNAFDAFLLSEFAVNALKWAGKLKVRPVATDPDLGEITARQAGRLRSLVQAGKYRRMVKPIVEGNVSSLSIIASSSRTKRTAVITEDNVGDYLPDDAKILPELENGSTHNFTGEVVGLQSTRGETIKVKVFGIDPSNSLLVAHPDDGQDSEDYKDFYKKPVHFTAQIYRKSMYKRPELIIKEMSLLQKSLI